MATMILSSPRMRSVANTNAKRLEKMKQKSFTKTVLIEENTRMRIQSEYLKLDNTDHLPHKI